MDKRNTLMKGIARLFYEAGYHQTTMRQVAQKLGVSNSVLYYHFKNKQEILFTIINDMMDSVLIRLEKIIESVQDNEERIRYIVEMHINLFLSHRNESKVLNYEARHLDADYRKIVEDKERRYYYIMRDVVNGIIELYDSQLDLDATTFSIFGMLNWIYLWYESNRRISPEMLSRNISELILGGLRGASSVSFPQTQKNND